MYVSARYWKEDVKGYAGRDYTFKTDMELIVGDKVLVPTGAELQEKSAVITAVNLPDDCVKPEWADKVKTITKYDEEEKGE